MSFTWDQVGQRANENTRLVDPPNNNQHDDRDRDEGCCCKCYNQNRLCVWVCVGILTLIIIILIALSFDDVSPTQYGLFQNGWSQVVDTTQVYNSGVYFVWLGNYFIRFPAYRVSIEFSASPSHDVAPVPARTGRDENDPDSGGQPVTLSFSFQYQFEKNDVAYVYKEFGEQYEARFILFARMAVSDVAQEYTPDKFWTDRAGVAKRMEERIRHRLRQDGHCEVMNFQLLQVDFPDKYEAMITEIQLQEQLKLTSEYQQQVTDVMKNIDVMTAKANAQIASINAGAAASGALIVNEAKTKGFKAQQSAKAEAYAELQTMLHLSNPEMIDYVKIRALTGSGREAASTVRKTA